jgi:hypothetical protein
MRTTGIRRNLRAALAGSLLSGGVLAVSVLSGSLPAGATTTVKLYVATTGGGTACTKASPCKSIGEAVEAAATDAGDNVIIKVAAGTYDETDSIAAGSLQSLSIKGAGASSTIVNGNNSNTTVMAFAVGTVSLSGFTIEDGGNADQTLNGGGISNAGTLTVSNTIFSSDSAKDGGAIFNKGSLRVSDTIFSSNRSNAAGGAIFNFGTLRLSDSTLSADSAVVTGGAISNAGQLSAQDVRFDDTSVTGAGGGGAVSNDGTAQISDSTFGGDLSPKGEGGAITNAGTLDLNDSTVSGGRAQTGGAISNGGSATITSSTLEDNTSILFGGAIANGDALVIADSTLMGNTAEYGGAVDAESGSLNLYDSTLAGNTLDVDGPYGGSGGGALDIGGVLDGNSVVNMIASTVSDNTGPQIDIDLHGSLESAASIIADTTSGQSSVSACQSAGTIADEGYNIADDSSCGFSATGSTNSSTNLDASLGALGENGGPTQTILPAATSPAVGVIPTGTTLDGVQVCPRTDQRGVASVGRCAIGAVEVTLCAVGLTPHVLNATYPTGTFTGLFCVNARGVGTYAQGTASGTGVVRTLKGNTVIGALGKNLLLAGSTSGTRNGFVEVAPVHAIGTFTLS